MYNEQDDKSEKFHLNENLLYVDLQREMRQSFIEYSMSVIVARALPDVRDGLKPVHRRILYTQFEKGLTYDKPYHKCADTVGNVLGSYHPHGDASVYDALVRLAQPFSLRYPLVDGHGNFGSIDGDPPAAYRYTESRMARLSSELLSDINKGTVDFGPNYDDRLEEPLVLPARFPNLLVNGSVGIAVGMATNIPPHNMGEAIDAALLLMQNPDCGDDELIAAINAPDFPTGGIIMGRSGIFSAYRTGRGKITLRGKAEIDDPAVNNDGRDSNGSRSRCARIIISEVPYMVKKSDIHVQIDELRTSKKVEGISLVRDESDRTGMRLVVELKQGANADVVLNHICGYTQFQTSVSLIMLALTDGQPRVLTLRQILEQFVSFQEEIVTRRARFELKKAQARAHILQGLMLAVDNIDEVIKILRASKDVAEGKAALIARFASTDLANLLARAMAAAGKGDYDFGIMTGLSDEQAESIVQMRLGQLTGLEQDKIAEELAGLMVRIAELEFVIADHGKRVEIIRAELLDIKKRYNDPRRTLVEDVDGEVIIEDLIPKSDIIVTFTDIGYIKRQNTEELTAQSRGGRGVTGMKQRDEDFVTDMLVSNTHHNMLFLSNKGHMFALKGYDLPAGGRQNRGAVLAGMLKLEEGERVSVIMSSPDFSAERYLVCVTKKGLVKRTALAEFSKIRKGAPLRSMGVDGDDEIVSAFIAESDTHIFIATRGGRAIRFAGDRVRASGRTAHGIRGIRLIGGDYVVGAAGLNGGIGENGDNVNNVSLLTVTENGIGKRTAVQDYPAKGRGGQGNINYKPDEKRGYVIGVRVVQDGDDVLMINGRGVIIRFKAESVRLMGRTAGGVRLMRLDEDGRVVAFARAERDESVDSEDLSGNEVLAGGDDVAGDDVADDDIADDAADDVAALADDVAEDADDTVSGE